MSKPLSAVVGLLVAGTAACSSASDAPASTSIPAALDTYCTGKLLVAKAYQSPTDGYWEGNGATLPAGTVFVVAEDFGHYGGYAFLNGTPAQLDGDFTKGLELGKDFESSCAKKPDRTNTDFVLLAKATLYPGKDLSGAPCTVPLGTKFKSYGYSSSGAGAAEFQSTELGALCGFEKGYTKDLYYGELLRK